ncbi:leucine-rich repeat-containing protein 25 [Hyperolius riggenbachi]|uniref:leucine-rich repeat-containing protein 25 n=1 Tax=Hyperolius riggenbachi TaxID=752182 RepID=UPI0035A32706
MWALIMVVMVFLGMLSESTACKKGNCETFANEHQLNWPQCEDYETVALQKKNLHNITGGLNYTCLKTLNLSSNELKQLPQDFLYNAVALENIDLKDNKLEKLPVKFLSNSSKLQELHLEQNQLSEIPSSVFQPGLRNLTVDCKCDVIHSIKLHLSNTSTNPAALSVTCGRSSDFEGIEDFFQQNCSSHKLLVLYIILPILALCFISGGAALHLWKKKKNSAAIGSKATQENSPSHGQPRYITNNMDAIRTTSNQGQRQDYENVFVGHLQPNKIKPYDYAVQENRTGAPRYNILATRMSLLALQQPAAFLPHPVNTLWRKISIWRAMSMQVNNQYTPTLKVYITTIASLVTPAQTKKKKMMCTFYLISNSSITLSGGTPPIYIPI